MTSPTPLADAPSGTWTIDPTATTVTVTVKKMKVLTVAATLTVASGHITVADGKVTEVNVTAEAGSYASPNTKRNDHVVGPDFLDAETFPTITFSATAADEGAGGGGTHRLSGDATVKGNTTPLSFDVSKLSIDGDVATFVATATADRFDLGVDKMPALVISRQMDISVSATAQHTP